MPLSLTVCFLGSRKGCVFASLPRTDLFLLQINSHHMPVLCARQPGFGSRRSVPEISRCIWKAFAQTRAFPVGAALAFAWRCGFRVT